VFKEYHDLYKTYVASCKLLADVSPLGGSVQDNNGVPATTDPITGTSQVCV